MKVLIIADSSMKYMPYINTYIKLFDKNKVEYVILNWDRYKLNDNAEGYQYQDKKMGQKRSLIDYFRYGCYVKKHLKKKKYDKLIIFGIPTAIILRKILIKKYREKYVIDIRDYHKLLEYISIEKLIEFAKFNVISSKGFESWLPISENYILNHNIQDFESYTKKKSTFPNKFTSIDFIGSLRDLEVNKQLVYEFLNSNIILNYYGDGLAMGDLEKYCKKINAHNVIFHGPYDKENEYYLYQRSCVINNIVSTDDINSKTLMTNRFYNALLADKPQITLKDTFMSEIVYNYDIGICVNSIKEIREYIEDFIMKIDLEKFDSRKQKLLREIEISNQKFSEKILKFSEK